MPELFNKNKRVVIGSVKCEGTQLFKLKILKKCKSEFSFFFLYPGYDNGETTNIKLDHILIVLMSQKKN